MSLIALYEFMQEWDIHFYSLINYVQNKIEMLTTDLKCFVVHQREWALH